MRAPPPRVLSHPPALALGIALAVLATAGALAPIAAAGGGPETTLVVVNGDSPVSKRVANDYVARRGIPATHVVEVPGVPDLRIVDIDTFRTRLWAPVKAYLAAHGLEERIDLIAWSADFPYGVDFKADEANPPNPPYTPIASLTAMTYFARAVEAKETKKWLPLDSNLYYRRGAGEAQTRQATDAEREAFEAADEALKKKDYAAAAAAFERGLATYQESEEIFYNYACCLARLGKDDAALAALSKAVERGWHNADLTAKDADLESLRGRPEFQGLLKRMTAEVAIAGVQPAHGFRARSSWTGAVDPNDAAPADSLDRYRLATMLAYTGEWGNSVPEATKALQAAIAADGTHPVGTFYFLVNGDVRATTRMGRFEEAVAALKARGHSAQILKAGEDGQTGVLPIGKDDVLGAMIGSAGFAWADSKSRLLPGSIAEHLTSFGAVFNSSGQTKCTELIRHGAAGSSGTVYEPYALEAKFPVPSIHVHYADGCSLAEAFYESVWGPYQLLVLGDGLARPFASFAKVTVGSDEWTGKGTLAVRPTIEAAKDRPTGSVELWVDGALAAQGRPGEDLALDTTALDDGPHDVRAVAVEADRVETRSYGRALLKVANGTRTVSIDGSGPRGVAAYESTITVAGHATGATEVVLYAGHRELGKASATSGAWKVQVPAARLGVGTTVVQARATGAAGPAARSAFVTLGVDAPAVRKGVKAAGARKGFVATLTPPSGKPVEVPLANLGGSGLPAVADAWKAKVAAPKQVAIDGEFDVATAGAYEFLVNASGRLAIDVDGRPALPETKVARDRQAYAYVSLAAGRHTLSVRVQPEGSSDVTVLLGGDRVTAPLASK